jgi:hypothetical protein
MADSAMKELCINCERGESEIPVLYFRFKGKERFICTSCLPTLLHRPDKLVGCLEGAESIEPSRHTHD